MRHLLFSFMPCAGVVAVQAGDAWAADEQSVAATIDLDAVLVALNAPDFATRQSAQDQLRNLHLDQISLLAEHAETTPAAETAVSCVRALQYHLLGDAPQFARLAWEALETLNSSDRHVVREEVNWVLFDHWKIRQKLATDELRKHGASIVLPESAAAAKIVHDRRKFEKQNPSLTLLQRRIFNGRRLPPPAVQVFFSAAWRSDLSALRILQRMPGLQMREAQAFAGIAGGRQRRPFGGRNRNGPTPVAIFLIGGHSLDVDSVTWLRGAFAQHLQERGEVMLGITGDGATVGTGCVIGTVVPFGSGDAAGLFTGDKITSLADRPIRSFQDLVDELRSFSAGEMVEVAVVRTVRQDGRLLEQTLEVPVVLRSWQDYADAVNKAAAEFQAGTVSVAVPTLGP
ncbi:MAG: PDZ domain-containing protein [Planctomycetaceae bacterium]